MFDIPDDLSNELERRSLAAACAFKLVKKFPQLEPAVIVPALLRESGIAFLCFLDAIEDSRLWYKNQIEIVNKRNKELEDLLKVTERALDNTVETLNDLSDDVGKSRRYSRSYFSCEQIESAKKQIELRICNHDIRWPHECRDCLDILSEELSVQEKLKVSK